MNTASQSDEQVVTDLIISRASEAPKIVIGEVMGDKDAKDHLMDLMENEPDAFFRFKEHLNGCGVTKTSISELEKSLKRHTDEVKRIEKIQAANAKLMPIHDMLKTSPGPDGLKMPRGYHVDENGVYTREVDGYFNDKASYVDTLIALAPVVISGRERNADTGEEFINLAHLRNKKWKTVATSRETIASSRLIVGLSASGLPITSINARDMVQYLSEFEAANLDILPLVFSTNHMGWQSVEGPPVFLLGSTCYSPDPDNAQPIVFRGADSGDTQIVEGISQAGTYEGWLEAITPIKNHQRALLAFYATFLPPLLFIFKGANFLLDLCGKTSYGKTVILRVNASVFGNPDERSPRSFLRTWECTEVYIERCATVLNGLPLLIDDTKLAAHRQLVGKIIYLIASGRGKGRGSKDGIRAQGHFRTVMQTTGEEPASSFTKDGGQYGRALSLWGSPWNTVDEQTGKIVDAIEQGVLCNYGHAGPKFIKYIMDHHDEWESWRKEYQEYTDQYREFAGNNSVARRLAPYLGALEFTAWHVHKALDLPWQYNATVENQFDTFVSDTSEADRARAAVDFIVAWANANSHQFHGRDDGYGIPSAGYAGKWDSSKVWEYIGFYKSRLENLLITEGFQPAAVLRSWLDDGVIRADHDRNRFTRSITVQKERVRMVCIERHAVEEVLD